MSRIFNNKKVGFDRKRVVEENSHPQPAYTQPQVEKTGADEVFKEFADLVNKANAVLPYFEDAARAHSISVPENMSDIRTAVARKDEQSQGGAIITFDLFSQALTHFESLRNDFTNRGLDDLTGVPLEDAQTILDNTARVQYGNLKTKDMPLFNSAWLVRFALWGLMKQFAVHTVLHQTSTKQPLATEVPGFTIDFINSIMMGFAIDAANKEFAEIAAEGNEALQSFIESTPGGFASSSNHDFSKYEQMAIDKIAEADFAKILDFSFKKISGTSDAALFSWLNYANVRGIRNDAVGAHRHSAQYTNKMSSGKPVVSMSQSYLSALEKQAKAMNGTLMLNMQVGGLKFDVDMLCCLTRFFGNIDTDTLKATRQLLKIASNMRGVEFGQLVNSTSSNYTNFIKKATEHGLIALLERTFDKVCLKALKSVDFDDKDYTLMAEGCPAFVDYSEIVFDSVEYLVDFATDLIGEVADDPVSLPPAKNPYAMTTSHIAHKKWIDTTLRLLDEVINVIDNSNCALDEQGSMPSERASELVAGVYNSTTNGTVEIPDEVLDTFFPEMGDVSLPAPGGRYSLTLPKNGTSARGIDERAMMRQMMAHCGKTLSDEDLDRMIKDTNGAI